MPTESEEGWTQFFKGLKERGLAGVWRVVSDAHGGLKATVRRVFKAEWQRGKVHFYRNVLVHVSKCSQAEVSEALNGYGREVGVRAAGREQRQGEGRRDDTPVAGPLRQGASWRCSGTNSSSIETSGASWTTRLKAHHLSEKTTSTRSPVCSPGTRRDRPKPALPLPMGNLKFKTRKSTPQVLCFQFNPNRFPANLDTSDGRYICFAGGSTACLGSVHPGEAPASRL